MRSLATGAALFSAVLLLAAPVSAARVLLVTVAEADGGWPEAEAKATSELAALSFEAVVSGAPPLATCASDSDTRAAIERQGALAALEIRWTNEARSSLRLCVVDLVTGKATARYFDERPLPDPGQAALLGVELVHASLLEVKARHPSRGSVAPPRLVERTVEEQLQRAPALALWLRGGPSALVSSSVASAGVALGASFPVIASASVELDLSVPLLSPTVSADEGSAMIEPSLALAGLGISPWRTRSLSTELGLGAGALLVRARGEAVAPLEDSSALATTWLAWGGGASAWEFSDSFALRLHARLAFVPEPVRVSFVGRPAAELGGALGELGLSLAYRFVR